MMLNIISVNARSLSGKGDAVQRMLATTSADILVVNETKVKGGPYVVDGYNCCHIPWKQGSICGTGTSLFYKPYLALRSSGLCSCSLCEFLQVRIRIGNLTFYLGAMYSKNFTACSWHVREFFGKHPKAMVVGDLNAKHQELGFRVTNAHGLALKTLVEDLGLEIRSSSEPNHIDSRGGQDWLGLALVSPGMLNWVSNTILLPDIGSDHLPLLHELREPVPQRAPGYFDLRSGSWANLERFMASRLPSLLVGNTCANIRELEALDNGINAALSDYMRDNFKQNPVQGQAHSTLPYRVLNKIRFKRRLSRLRDKCVYQENRVWFRGWISRLQREIRREIREHESSRWERACQRVDPRFPDFWKN
ncbi:uncharacterized protein LOC115231178 [Octopus sinensis]|uniref:Uncharacterized protein LOC115231178 n=1 Tax=Octopus sinensis TaxID=2607531 RepID=A0A6P7TXF5_9MOLL|nr:uncharacterized protein LOC115231178 [Octopus sinensis]